MEIKRTVLPPYGGSREEMGGGTSAWTYGRGVIGSPADGVVVPNLIGLNASEALEALENAGLVSSVSNTASGATEGNDGTVGSQSPNPGILVNAGSTVVYSIFEYVATPPAALVGPTTNWISDTMSSNFRFPGITVFPDELNSPTEYKLVLSGGSIDGEWTLPNDVSISFMDGNILVIRWGMMTSNRPGFNSPGAYVGTTNTGSAPGSPTVDNATASIVSI
jgi:hypothetical protein